MNILFIEIFFVFPLKHKDTNKASTLNGQYGKVRLLKYSQKL